MTGYEKSRDYGSPLQTRWLGPAFGVLLLTAAIGLFVISRLATPPKCQSLGQDKIEYEAIDGKLKATLTLSRIPKGECVTIRTGSRKAD